MTVRFKFPEGVTNALRDDLNTIGIGKFGQGLRRGFLELHLFQHVIRIDRYDGKLIEDVMGPVTTLVLCRESIYATFA